MKRILLFAVLLTLLTPLAGKALAQGKLPSASEDTVKVEIFPSLDPIPAKDVFKVAVRIQIQKGWHINAHEGLPEGFIPLDLSLGQGASFELAGPIEYPLGVQKALGGVAQAFPVHENEVRVIVSLKLKGTPKGVTVRLPLQLRLQACNDKVCLRPSSLSLSTEVRLGTSGQPSKPINAEMFNAPPEVGGGSASENIISRYLDKYGILLTFALIFLGGLALNLTPCVYPMIPLTISYFGNQRAEKPAVILARAAAYVVGISVTYSSLGVTAALTGKILGSSLQSPWVLAGISLVLVGLSLSMFGLYEIQAPAWLLNKVAAGNTQGWLGAMGMGLVFGIVAAPCVDPFSIGLLTFVAAKANPYLGFIMFFTLSLGLGFPYLWLGFFSNEIQRLPKSGMWMVWVKKIFGLILFGMPLYFLNPLLPKGFDHYAVSIYLVACGVLLGWIFSGAGVSSGFKKFQHVFGIVLVLMGLSVYKLWPQPFELPFQPYDSKLLQQAKQDGEPVFIDFTASWCLPCKELEIKTFSSFQVFSGFKGWMLLKADLSQYSSGPVEELKKTYGIMGVPTLVIIGPDGVERKELRTIGFISSDELREKIDQVHFPRD